MLVVSLTSVIVLGVVAMTVIIRNNEIKTKRHREVKKNK